MPSVLPEEFLNHLCEDYGLEKILELHDIEQQFVLELLINEGVLDLEDLRFNWETSDED